jgi:hypothetical protein
MQHTAAQRNHLTLLAIGRSTPCYVHSQYDQCLRYQLRRTMRAALMGYSLCKVAFALLIHFAAPHKCTLKRTATLVWLRAVGASIAQVSQRMLLHRSLRSSGSSAEGRHQECAE